jgi:integrase
MSDASKARLVKVAGRAQWLVYHNRKRISTGTTDRAAAERFLADFTEALAEPEIEAGLTTGELLDRYLDNRRKRKIPGAERLEWAHKQLKKHFENTPPDLIDGDMCVDYRNRRFEQNISPATVRTELEALRAALKWAVSAKGKRLIPEMPDLELPDKVEPKDRWLERDEAMRLLECCRGRHVRLFVILALNTAARHRAILSLTWDRVDLERRLLQFPISGQTKTKKRRVPVPINDTLYQALTEAKAQATSPYVIEWAGAPVKSVKHAIANACERAGIKDVTPHTFRHTAVTWMLQRGVSVWDVAGFAGMSPEMVTKTYGKHAPGYLIGAAKALSDETCVHLDNGEAAEF